MKALIVLACLSALAGGSPALAGRSFTVVTENNVDVANLFTHPDLKNTDPAHAGVPAAIAHAYTLRATYTIVGTEAEAKTRMVPAGCDGMDGAISCWPDHWESRLNLNNPGNRALWELIDARTGAILATRTAPLDIGEVFNSDVARENVNFTGPQGMGMVSLPSRPEQGFALAPSGGFSLFFSEMFLDALYRGAHLTIEPRGNNRFALVGLEYGGQTATGDVLPVVPGAAFPNAGVWLAKASDPQHPFLVGERGSQSPWTKIQVKSVQE